ncbi:MAG: acyl-CoA dehydrogenase family protein, partial [Acidimicrobiaceae bacterium]
MASDLTNITIEQFTADAHKFLAANAEPRESKKAFVWGEGSDNVSMFEERSKQSEDEMVSRAKQWRQQKFDAGFGWISGPEQYGGRGLSNEFEKAYSKAEAQYKVANQSIFQIGLGMVAPTILAHASDFAREKYLRAMWRADIVACQLFSEPGAGS